MKGSAVARIHFFYIATGITVCVLLGALFYYQVIHGDTYRAKAEQQYIVPNPDTYARGSIYFSTASDDIRSAATIRYGAKLAINPTQIEDPESVYEKLTSIIDIKPSTFFPKARKTTDPYEEIARQLSTETGQKIRDLGIPGVIIAQDSWRYYPADQLAAHTIGFVGYDGDRLNGRYGLERYYDDVLERSRSEQYVNFFAEIISNLSTTFLEASNERAGDVVTHLEPTVQSYVEEELQSIQKDWDVQEAGAIVMDPQTGAVHAMAALPSYDPNTYGSVADNGLFPNPIVENVYEMGSIIKALTMAAGLDADVVSPHTTYVDEGFVIVNGERINNWDGKGRGKVDMQEVLNQSLNTGAVYVMQQLGKDQFREYMRSYGIGEETGIDLPNEASGLTDNLKSTREVEYATASFGQGIAMSPIATARALSALANNGKIVTPHVAKRIEYEAGGSHEISPLPPEQVLKPETSKEITRMLVGVVDEALAKNHRTLPHYSIAAKTGTAQMAKEEGSGYYENKYLHSFFGYFPAYDPEFLVLFYAVDPQAYYASQTLTDPFIDTAEFLLNYYQIPPDR